MSDLKSAIQALTKDILNEMDLFKEELNANVEKGNKAAGQRARKHSLRLTDLFKKYRAGSVRADKNKN